MSRATAPLRGRRSLAFLALAALSVVVLLALGVWQVERRAWKLALIAQVEHRIHAMPVPAPGPGAWGAIGTASAYTHVAATGRYAGPDTLVQAVTDLGPGYWVVTALRTPGFTVLVNRGFVASDHRAIPRPDAATGVTGLLRISEPGGAFLRRNDPAAGRWYSRDVRAIAAATGIGRAAPYFIDADAATGSAAPGAPVGGLTVVTFANNHLVYALTWFTLAAMVVGGVIVILRRPHPASGRRA